MHAARALVAIVDDEESVRRALARLVRSAGFDVQAHGSGAEFLHALGRSAPQCVLLDLRMPQMGGLDVQAVLAEAHPELPIVVITGDDSPGIRERTLAAGAKAFLRKPVDVSALLDAIRHALREHAPP